MKLSQKTILKLRSKYGDWALVTGASNGIGKEIAKGLAQSKINLIINARNENELNMLAAKWRGQFGINIKTIAADLGTAKGISKIIEHTEDKEIGLLVTAAGFGTSGKFINNSLEEELNMMNVNCKAVLVLVYEFANRFKAQHRGGVILFSSLVAFQGTPYAANYAATKAYIQIFGEGLNVELKPYNIDVLVAAPGPVKTGFGKRANMKMDNAESPELVVKNVLNALGKKSTVVPGKIGKFLTYSLRLLPRWGKVKVMKMVMGGMTQHQNK